MGNISNTNANTVSAEQNAVSSESPCPMRAKPAEGSAASACPVRATGDAAPHSQGAAESSGQQYKNPHVYNVYNQKINPTNNMPTNANQQPSSGQTSSLDQQRVKSTIPKGGTDTDTWQYPSPQMFWNALVRKNKQDGASEADIADVVTVHNNMNETTWKQVMIWENLQAQEYKPGEEPKLLRFLGRPDDLSPRAYIKSLFGHPKPFDRHDWFVDRAGRQVRYIIDYYHDESNISNDVRPSSMHDTKSMKSIFVEVRPAADSVQAVVDRVFVMPFKRFQKSPLVANYLNVPFFAQGKMLQAEAAKRQAIDKQWAQIQTNCDKHRAALQTCRTDQECSVATVQLQKCSASVVCPELVQMFDGCIQNKMKETGEANIETAYTGMLKCLEMFEIESKQVLEDMKR